MHTSAWLIECNVHPLGNVKKRRILAVRYPARLALRRHIFTYLEPNQRFLLQTTNCFTNFHVDFN